MEGGSIPHNRPRLITATLWHARSAQKRKLYRHKTQADSIAKLLLPTNATLGDVPAAAKQLLAVKQTGRLIATCATNTKAAVPIAWTAAPVNPKHGRPRVARAAERVHCPQGAGGGDVGTPRAHQPLAPLPSHKLRAAQFRARRCCTSIADVQGGGPGRSQPSSS